MSYKKAYLGLLFLGKTSPSLVFLVLSVLRGVNTNKLNFLLTIPWPVMSAQERLVKVALTSSSVFSSDGLYSSDDLICIFIYMCVYMYVRLRVYKWLHELHCVCRDHRKPCGSLFPPCTMWVLGLRFKLPDLVVIVFFKIY